MKNDKQNIIDLEASDCEARRQAIMSLSKDELIKKYSDTIRHAVKSCVWNTGADASVDDNDFFQIGCLVVCKVQEKYDGSSEFSSYIFTCVINAVRKYIKTLKKHMDFENRLLVDDETFNRLFDTIDEDNEHYIPRHEKSYDPFEEKMDPLYDEDGLYSAIRKVYSKAKPTTKRNIVAFLMREEECSIEKIASTFGSTKDQASNYISAGKKYLAKQAEIKKFFCA